MRPGRPAGSGLPRGARGKNFCDARSVPNMGRRNNLVPWVHVSLTFAAGARSSRAKAAGILAKEEKKKERSVHAHCFLSALPFFLLLFVVPKECPLHRHSFPRNLNLASGFPMLAIGNLLMRVVGKGGGAQWHVAYLGAIASVHIARTKHKSNIKSPLLWLEAMCYRTHVVIYETRVQMPSRAVIFYM
jgi:hypothetical protein